MESAPRESRVRGGAGDENVVRSLLSAGADPNQMQRTTGSYAIHIPEPMLPVGEIGWYVNAVSPLGVAACAGNLRIVELLLSEGARLVPEDAVEPLEMAAMAGQLDMVRFLLSVGADANGARLRGSSLTAASRNGRYEVVRVLIEHGAEVNVKPGGLTPLIWAVMNAHVKVVRVLMQAGADPTEPVLSTTAAELAEQSPNAAIPGARLDAPIALDGCRASLPFYIPLRRYRTGDLPSSTLLSACRPRKPGAGA